MYLALTTRCNMKCKHCLYACTTEGEDMSREVFTLGCLLARERNENLSLGGGEPTVHPELLEFINIALAVSPRKIPGLVTNGKLARETFQLVDLALDDLISLELSRDIYHEPIIPSVVQIFEKNKSYYIGIRDTTAGGRLKPIPTGRAQSWAGDRDLRCPANELYVVPDGTIYACGCQDVTYGTVFEPQIPPTPKDQWCSRGWGWIDFTPTELLRYKASKQMLEQYNKENHIDGHT